MSIQTFEQPYEPVQITLPPDLITEVPGLPHPVAEPSIVAGQRIRVEHFMGDPRRVPGHPSNPATLMIEAMLERSDEQ